MSEIDDKCECCGRPGRSIGDGDEARVRCVRHEYVVDVDAWKKELAEMPAMFETEEEALAHFLQDYGDGLDMMQELAREDGEDDETRH